MRSQPSVLNIPQAQLFYLKAVLLWLQIKAILYK